MTAIRAQLLEMMRAVASALGEDLRSRLVFVGGCTTALFITDLVTLEDVRATDDIDLIVDLAGLPAWAQLQEELRQRGFMEAADEVICRMRLGKLTVDFMPDDPAILGFGNRWYAGGIETTQHYQLSEDLAIRILTPPMFLATKLEAYAGRGNGDLIMSRDAEDILLIVDGREELLAEVTAAGNDVRNFIAGRFCALLEQGDFDDFLDGNIRGPIGRVEIVKDRFVSISNCADGTAQ
ncbi:nucleotidyl transferase AbiEii/AbiGii toxin family protein [Agrobacterium rosae]|uniref:nucleotidyl transferase AbiEii/AbiGii toxin family protein n=1 Tax=Agrobacterium rosae TaxID=1972867 RepID=UPI00203351B0|nr:nucleotidyl transferase AbiEii/AbiGii toxin family protein [Agrobacterium rosae]MCM2435582.1 nucleotidyl transferase AbiEii/AbiGii toxin family protein [Agrobacterium rosae]